MRPGKDEDREGIQADRPAGPAGIQADKPPPLWEALVGVRLSCRPHRGNALFWAAGMSLALAIFSFVLCLPVLAAMPLALIAGILAHGDLRLMREGLMDPRGERLTREARKLSLAAFCLSCPVAIALLNVLLQIFLK